MPTTRPDHAPSAWPGLLSEELAAYYCGQMSIALFRREVAAGRLPQPVALTPGRIAWVLEELDAWRLSRRMTPAPRRPGKRRGAAREPLPTSATAREAFDAWARS